MNAESQKILLRTAKAYAILSRSMRSKYYQIQARRCLDLLLTVRRRQAAVTITYNREVKNEKSN